AAINPVATELPADGVDQNCDSAELCYLDGDDDGFRPDATATVLSDDLDCADFGEAIGTDPVTDCDDDDAAINPLATELPADGVDQNCDSGELCFADGDDDGFRPDATATVASDDLDCADFGEAIGTDPTGDCADGDAAVNPGASEITGDGFDQNCDGAETCWLDFDDDGYRPDATSTVASTDTDCADYGEAVTGDPTTDCDDAIATCTTDCVTDVDTDGTPDCADTCLDGDGDGYGVGTGCTGLDCDDTVASCYVACETDYDSDGVRDCEDTCIDVDGDHYGAGTGCLGADCDDFTITCNVDCVTDSDFDFVEDCADYCLDSDGDYYGLPGGAGDYCAGVDCNDANPSCWTAGVNTLICDADCTSRTCGDAFVNPVASEVCDEPPNLGGYDGCDACTALGPYCGDGVVQDPPEECDTAIDPECHASCTWDFYCDEVSPTAIANASDSDLSVFGAGFDDDMFVTLVGPETAVVDPYWLTDSGAVALLESTLGLDPGTYHVWLTNEADAETTECPDTITVVATTGITVTDVAPAIAWTGDPGNGISDDAVVRIAGTGFLEVPLVRWVNIDEPGIRYDAPYTLWDGGTTLTSVCPSESESMVPGTYYVEVLNPHVPASPLSDLGAFWLDGTILGEFTVTATQPPIIGDLDPFRSPGASPVTVTINGSGFQAGAQVIFGTIVMTSVAVDLSGAFITVGVPSIGNGMYPVRVINPDGQEDTFYYYLATPSSDAHLSEFGPMTTPMAVARWRHASIQGFDPYENAYVYTAGGLGSLLSPPPPPDTNNDARRDVEIMPVSNMGAPSAPWIAKKWDPGTNTHIDNLMNTPRQGFSISRYGDWLYAVGGCDKNTAESTTAFPALNSVERAEILDNAHQPQDIEYAVDASIGTLPLGSWYYRVSAVGAWGESLPSDLQLVFNGEGSVVLTWATVAGATGYLVYRNATADGDHGDVGLLAVITTTTTTYTDTGAAPNMAVTPLPLGSIGPWVALSSTLVSPREGLDTVKIVVPDGVGGASPYIYAVGGRTSSAVGAASLSSIEIAPISDDGSLGAFSTLSHTMVVPRGFFALLTSQGQNSYISRSEYFDPDETIHLIATAGDDVSNNPNNSGLMTFEIAQVNSPSGETTDWTVQSQEWNKSNLGHDGQLFFGTMFLFQAVSKESRGSNPTLNGGTSPRYRYTPTNPAATIINTYQSSSNGPSNRAYYQTVRLKSFVFVIGGNDGSGPIDLIDRGY
ncbi:MAG: MopE-related protein, partial [Proteobacteria bacterium]|nr:MopE-related protein [Pseudomonadota bacterium]